MSHYTMLSKYGNYMRLLKIKNKLKIGCFTNEVAKNSGYFVGFFTLTLVGYKMIIANSALCALLANYHLISNVHLWNNC